MQRVADWGLAGGEARLVVFRVVIDEGTTPVLLDLGLYFLVGKKKNYLSFIFIVIFFCLLNVS